METPEPSQKKKKSPSLLMIVLVTSTYIALGAVAYMWEFNLTSTILAFFALTTIYGMVYGIYYALVKLPEKKKIKAKEVDKLTPNEAKDIALKYLLEEFGIVPGKIELDTAKPVGEEGERKQLWHWLRFLDRIDGFNVDIFRNMHQVEMRAIHFGLSKPEAERELRSLGSPLTDKETFIRKFYDPNTQALLRVEEGTIPRAIGKVIEVKKEEPGTVTGSAESDKSE